LPLARAAISKVAPWDWRYLGEKRRKAEFERLWRSIKYEEVHLKAYADGCEARSGISSWMNFYNFRRLHQAINNQMPMAVWRAGMDKIEAAVRAVDMPLRLDNANALPTYPQQKQQEAA
jgi:putative transposase